jgi:integrase
MTRRRTLRALSPGQVETIRSRVGLRDAILVSTMGYAGLRPGEALGLSLDDVGERTIHVQRAVAHGTIKGTKTNRTRSVRLLPSLARDLREWRRAGDGPRAMS